MGKITGFKEFDRKNFNKRPIEERVKDYKKVYVPLNDSNMKEQASRCMECGTPFCNFGCPLSNVAPDFNDLFYRGQYKKAYERLARTNDFPEFTGRICPALCEAACTLGINRQAVCIREIEQSIIEKAFKEEFVKKDHPKVRTGKNICIVGSGPAGLSVASQLNSVGHQVTVFEKNNKPGGLLRYGIPDFKLEKSIIDRRIDIMEKQGVRFKTSVEVGKDVLLEEIFEEFHAIVLTGGCAVPRDLKIEGRELEGIHFAVDYLSQQNKRVSKEKFEEEEINAKDKNVVVIGGGDTGSDCIGTAIRQGAKKVHQIEIMPKPSEKRDESSPWPTYPRILKTTTSHEEGGEREWNVLTKDIKGTNGKVEKLICSKVSWNKDDNGKFIMKEIENSEFEIKVDLILIAMGFLHPKVHGIINELCLKLDERGNVYTDKNGITSIQGVFCAGDMATGQSLVVKAIKSGREVSKTVDEYLMGSTFLKG
ncbi:glutamate synthase subunit beta [Clostridium sp. Marseille-Q2269]|uniref:glutamate synthase subunit beta n=1 Tax=Clostridium sp. Marseille-Q2269 TaxID=2942205 RepID=UPI0020738FFF|nr:glutamate synthase subunit beta [Clostridium sp. Marseille-Q2269]